MAKLELRAFLILMPVLSLNRFYCYGDAAGGSGRGGPEDLLNLMAYLIEKEQCLPGFIASLTLECYEKGKTRW